MTNSIDRFWIARGVNAEELNEIPARGLLYTGLMSMAVTATLLIGGIFSNLTAPVA